MTTRHLVVFRKALESYFVKENMSYSETYERMCSDMFVKWTRDSSGKKTKHRIDPALLPSRDQFYYHAKSIVAAQGLRERKAGHLDWSMRYRSRTGSSADISLGPTDVYDMDAVDLKCHMVTDDSRAEECGRVSAVLCVDRGSSAVVGFHDFIGAEKWDHYRFALYWAFSDTRTHLEAIGGHPLSEQAARLGVYGPCNGVYVDRGPGRSKKAFMSIVESMRLERAIAPARRGDLKATNESINGIFQRKVAQLPGGYTRRSGVRHEQRAKVAASQARLTRRQIRDFLISAIIEHNEFYSVPHLLTAEMIRDGVPPVPAEIFRWGKENICVRSLRHLSAAELYFKLLPQTNVRVRRRGVQHGGGHFSSEELIKYRHRNLGNRSLTIRIHWDGADPTRRYWKAPNGSVDTLTMSKAELAKFEGMSVEERERQLLRDRAHGRINDIERRRKGYISNNQERILADIVGTRPARQRPNKEKGLTRQQNRNLEEVRQQQRTRTISRSILEPLTEGSGNSTNPNQDTAPSSAESDAHSDSSESTHQSTARDTFNRIFKRGSRS